MSGFVPRVGILLATYNGARFLQAQLESFRAQTEAGWVLFWRDDGSTDDTIDTLGRFAAEIGPDRCRRVPGGERLGASGSFFALLCHAAGEGIPLAFADQDDVWLPDKLAWALERLGPHPGPALYCSRQLLVDDELRPLGISAPWRDQPSFANALTQNIATGCTVVLNPAATSLLARSTPSPAILHDWWSYLLVTAAGGAVVADERPSVLYRQHGANLVGAAASRVTRARAALRRGPQTFMAILRANVACLLDQPALLTGEARATLLALDRALGGRAPSRLRALALPGFRRQTALETALFRCWFLFG